jgi:polar amino acid transport system substrate-binding protein
MTFLRPFVPLAVAFAILFGVSFLPSDESFQEIQQAKRLTVCAPRDMAPLVTRDREKPGFEIELLREAATRMGLTISVTQNAAMNREYNPANWRISRANCRVVVGGIRDNVWSRSLLELTDPYLSSEWTWIHKGNATWPPESTAFAPGTVAFDRVALAQSLIKQGVDAVPMQNVSDLMEAFTKDEISSAITDSAIAAASFTAPEFILTPVPSGPDATGFSFGFWKGDTTLRREMNAVLSALKADGTIAKLANDYGLTAN